MGTYSAMCSETSDIESAVGGREGGVMTSHSGWEGRQRGRRERKDRPVSLVLPAWDSKADVSNEG